MGMYVIPDPAFLKVPRERKKIVKSFTAVHDHGGLARDDAC